MAIEAAMRPEEESFSIPRRSMSMVCSNSSASSRSIRRIAVLPKGVELCAADSFSFGELIKRRLGLGAESDLLLSPQCSQCWRMQVPGKVRADRLSERESVGMRHQPCDLVFIFVRH